MPSDALLVIDNKVPSMKQPDRHILEKIVEETTFLENLLAGMDMGPFAVDDTVKRTAAKTRDVYAHGYYTLNFETVYKTATEDYPRVKAWILEQLDS